MKWRENVHVLVIYKQVFKEKVSMAISVIFNNDYKLHCQFCLEVHFFQVNITRIIQLVNRHHMSL